MTNQEIALQRRAARLVEREVHACMSSLVATLAAGYSTGLPRKTEAGIALDDLAQQAEHLASPVLDYEGAAREAGWTRIKHSGMFNGPLGSDIRLADFESWEECCEENGIEPHECEVFEHWSVSSWLAEKLIAKGERVDTDFAGLNVWARTTTGQAISADSVIETITAETGYASGVEA